MKLEEQVAPLELCEQLPEDAFADSAFVWYYPYNEGSQWDLIPRSEAGKEPMYAAPTLVEILPELYALAGADVVETYFDASGWSVRYVYTLSDGDVDDDMLDDNDNPAYAALKLWLDLTKGGKDGK